MRNVSRRILLAVLLAMGVALASCSNDAGGTDKTSVLASVYPLGEVARRVGGDAIEVSNLTRAGTEPHDVELGTDEVDRVQDADLVLFLGAGFQPAVEDAIDSRDGRSLDLLEAVPVQRGASTEDEADPHFWLDPTLLAQAVEAVEAALADLVPGSEATFAQNAEKYRAELADLHREIADRLSDCERGDVVTSHAAFHYLAERYGLRQRPIAGISPEAEPDPERLDELVDLVEDEGVTTIFSETLVSAEVAETLAREADVDTAVLDPIEGLTDERLAAGDTYATVMRENAAALAEALGCA